MAEQSNIPLRIKRTGPQLLHNELVAEELIAGAPSRNGGRLLEEGRDPWTHNAWYAPLRLSLDSRAPSLVRLTARSDFNRDKVEWDEEQEKLAQQAVEKQMTMAVPPELQEEYNANPASFWDTFYANVKGECSLRRPRSFY
jgi:tRNAThr (cytosine32-N3)-methyltransferase